MSPETPARFVVFGAGAIGSVFAARLAERHPVAVVARGRRLAQIVADGIRIEGATEAAVRPRAVALPRELVGFRPDYVLVTVKAHATRASAPLLEPLGQKPVRVSLQNGLGNEEALAAGGYPVIGAVSNNGATLREHGGVFHAGLGEVILSGFQAVSTPQVERLARCFAAAGFPVERAADIGKPLWEKTILNAAVNPLTALLGIRTGQLLADPGAEHLLRKLIGEGTQVARAEGVRTSETEVRDMTLRVIRRTSGNRTSMLQDLERGVRTEVDAMNGAIVSRAAKHGIATPWNRLMLRLIRQREGGRQQESELGARR